MKHFVLLLLIPFLSLNAQDLLKDLKLPIGKKAQKLEKKLAKKQQIIDSLKSVNADLLEQNKLLSDTKKSNITNTAVINSSIIDKVVLFEDMEVSDDMYLFFNIPADDGGTDIALEFRGGTISPQLLDSELMGQFEMGKHINQKFRVLYEIRETKVWEGGMDWGEWVIEKGPFLIGIEKL